MTEPETFIDGKVTLLRGDCLERLREIEECSVDSCVTDPPYHLTSIVKRYGGERPKSNMHDKDRGNIQALQYKRLAKGFMGKQWDGGDIAFQPLVWELVFRALKPGAHLLAFSGTRTYHRMACAIEDAGFDIRDQIAWTYGSGFPKSHNIGNGWGTALKPAWEPIVLARKPLSESSIAQNVLEWGTGAINIDGCRINPGKARQSMIGGMGRKASPVYGQFAPSEVQDIITTQGRWPANLIHDGSEEVLAGFPEVVGQTGMVRNVGGSIYSPDYPQTFTPGTKHSGSAARFFYTAKADADDRLGSKHPTVKPLDLIQYLVRLVTPKGGIVLDPFAGTGTTGEAAWREGFRACLVEREEEYQADIVRRVGLCLAGPDERRAATVDQLPPSDLPMFAGLNHEPSHP